jgi:hypothetical protein
MFIALRFLLASALRRSAMCFWANSYMSLLRSEIILDTRSYKHLAPSEQRISESPEGDF